MQQRELVKYDIYKLKDFEEILYFVRIFNGIEKISKYIVKQKQLTKECM